MNRFGALVVPGGSGWVPGRARMVAALIVVPFLVLSLYPAVGGAPFVGMVG